MFTAKFANHERAETRYCGCGAPACSPLPGAHGLWRPGLRLGGRSPGRGRVPLQWRPLWSRTAWSLSRTARRSRYSIGTLGEEVPQSLRLREILFVSAIRPTGRKARGPRKVIIAVRGSRSTTGATVTTAWLRRRSSSTHPKVRRRHASAGCERLELGRHGIGALRRGAKGGVGRRDALRSTHARGLDLRLGSRRRRCAGRPGRAAGASGTRGPVSPITIASTAR